MQLFETFFLQFTKNIFKVSKWKCITRNIFELLEKEKDNAQEKI